jgi:hypothetical protein
MSEKGPEAGIEPHRFNVSEVPEAAIGECERPALAAAVCQCAFGGDDRPRHANARRLILAYLEFSPVQRARKCHPTWLLERRSRQLHQRFRRRA